MGFIKSGTISNINDELKKGNYVLTKEDAIANNKLAGKYVNNILVEPYTSINAEIAAEAAKEGLTNTIWQMVAGKNLDGIKAVINTITTGSSNGAGAPFPDIGTNPRESTSSSGFPVNVTNGFNWSKWIPIILGSLVVAALIYKFRAKIF